MRGVEAIFTGHDPARRRISKTAIVGIAEISVLLIIYASLVREYSASVDMQLWVHTNFGLGQILLTYDAVLVVAGLAAILVFSIFRKSQETRKIRKRARHKRGR